MGNVTIQKSARPKPTVVELVPIVQEGNREHFVADAIKQMQGGLYTGPLVFNMQHSLLRLSECPELLQRDVVKDSDVLSQFIKVSDITYRNRFGEVHTLHVRSMPDVTFVDEPNRRKRVNFIVEGHHFGSVKPYLLFSGHMNMVGATVTMDLPECDDIELLGFQVFGHRVNYNE